MSAADGAGSGTLLIDISAPLHEGLVTWPGVVERFGRSLVASIAAGDAMTVSHLHLGAHAGTHIDAPCHFLADAGGIETIRLDALLGPAFVVEVPAGTDVISAAVLDAAGVPAGTTRLLARTANSGWSRSTAGFREDYVAFDASAARWCLDRSVALVGIDYLSVERFDADVDGYPVHRALLGAGVVVLESIDLEDVAPGAYELSVLPLLIPGADGAPARRAPRGLTSAPASRFLAPTTSIVEAAAHVGGGATGTCSGSCQKGAHLCGGCCWSVVSWSRWPRR